ncbi:MAG: hypothetical protein JJLCMIEE_03127 [Acidimicrobiales bacterium]|nr:MAG: DNA-binding protein [Actinomycetota bacterium]MBV6510008.1 hypothetical protein [Acidimicrobiales bacterium]RIK04301.1 MAG: DNA-binding protein [Acidobacteriota bacterium]
MTRQVAIAEGLLSWASGEARLIGSRCETCGVVVFPSQRGCPACTGEETEVIELGTRGTLWTFTTQGFLPKWPYAGPGTDEAFEPYAVGYVELPGQVRVEARLVEVEVDDLHIGMDMELCVVPFITDDGGDEVVVPAFRPSGASVDGASA